MDHKNEVTSWLKSSKLDQIDKDDYLASSLENQEDCFNSYLPFGTGGMRGVMGFGPNRINNITIARAAYGFGLYLLDKGLVRPKIIIGYDNRINSKAFAIRCANVLTALNAQVYLFDKLAATPIVSYAIRHLQADGGIIITASHNPKQYNGFKVYDSTGCQLLPDDIKAIVKNIDKIDDVLAIEELSDQYESLSEELINHYYEELLKYMPRTNNDKLIKIGYSPQHGTGLVATKFLLDKYGYDNVVIVKEQASPDGAFPNTKSANPEDDLAFEQLIEYGHKYNLDLLMATDPDADRLGVMCKDNDGYKRITGNQLGALLLDYCITKNITLNEKSYIVKTIVSSELGAMIAKAHNIKVIDVLTGFKYIGAKINEYGPTNFIGGYEESYGYLMYPLVRDKDALQIIILCAEMANHYLENNITLVDKLASLYKEYGYYQETLINIDFDIVNGMDQMIKIYESFKNINLSNIICKEDYESKLRYSHHSDLVETIDFEAERVLKYYLDDECWFCIRPSGTEPKLKIYIGVKGSSDEDASDKLLHLKEYITKQTNQQ